MRLLQSVLSLSLLLVLFAGELPAQQNLRFGASMVVSGDEIVVGEVANQLRPGTVYLYRRGSSGWEEAAQLRAPDAEVRDGFGAPLAVSGSTLFVGQDGDFRVFERTDAGSYELTETIAQPETEEGESFGASAAAEGDWLLVGAPVGAGGRGFRGGGDDEEEGPANPGAVYAFQRDATGGWVQRGKLTASDAEAEDGFGSALVVSNGLALVGAPGRSDRQGAAYLFRLDEASGGWNEVARFVSDAAEPGAGFGSSVALGDGLAVIGVPQYAGGHGAAYVYAHQGDDSWAEHARLLPFIGSSQDRFGTNVAAQGRDIWVGAPSTGRNTGRVFHFRAVGEEMALEDARHWDLDETTRSDRFGNRVLAAQGIALVAATGKDHGSGSVAVFEEGADDGGWGQTALLESEEQALPRVVGEELECEDGSAGMFECSGPVSLLSYTPVKDLTIPGQNRGTRVNDIWGWQDPETGREYALVGRVDGTSFVDVTDPLNPELVGVLPQTPGGPPAPTWRDPKVYQNYAVVVADAAGAHGMQIFDLTQLRDVQDGPVEFEPTTVYRGINSAHNVLVNEETGFAYVVGASAGGQTCGGGLHMVDIRDPLNPEFAGCFAHEGTGRTGGGYTHDAQCVVYRGPDERYQGRELCFAANERQLSIADVTDKENPVALSTGEYPNPGYLHQGWLTDDHRYFFMDDELDLINESVETTRTLVFDVSDLEDPVLHLEFMGSHETSAHNLYIRDDVMYQANYRGGLHVIDVSDPSNPVEMGHLDTSPYLSGAGFSGAWSNYPFFESGAIGVASGHEGLFLVRYRDPSVVFED